MRLQHTCETVLVKQNVFTFLHVNVLLSEVF